ncbi:MAG TPA: ABC transporter permease [Puia sp.]|nr:ABC transporter permease [Puia sp.]
MNKLIFRRLRRHGGYTVLNIAGLTIGLTAAFLIFLYVRFERSYDDFHSKAARIYRLCCDEKTPTGVIHQGLTSAPMSIAAARAFPEIEAVVREDFQPLPVRRGALVFQEEHSAYADSGFFQVFDFPLLRGDAATALKAPLSVVLSASTARKYFGDSDPMGQTLLIRDERMAGKVTGIMKDMPENTELKADMLISKSTTRLFHADEDKQWAYFGLWAYVLLKPNVDAHALEKKFPAFVEQQDGAEEKTMQMWFTLSLEPLRDLYLYAGDNGGPVSGDPTNVFIFSMVGIFVLLIAGINFVNLTTARSTERAREVGIRKVAGAWRGQLILDFLAESALQALIAFGLAILLCRLLIPAFNGLIGKPVSTGLLQHPGDLLIFLGISVGIGLVAGIYPALLLSAFRPVVVLKGRFATGTRGLLLRRSLVIFQFVISIGFIAATFIIRAELNYLRNHPLGFNNRQMLVLQTYGDERKFALKTVINQLPDVLSTGLCSSSPGGDLIYALSNLENKKGALQTENFNLYLVDFDYMRQHKIPLVAGRMFSPAFATDSTQAMIINEDAVKDLGYASPVEAIGRKFNSYGREGRIIGVMKDFNYYSLHYAISPLGMLIAPLDANLLSVQVNTAGLPGTVAAIKGAWKKMLPDRPFSYYFEDEFFNRQYRNEDRFGRLFADFSLFAILISSLGLLGLASYSTLQRTREIGIRKVLGASVATIVRLLSGEFLRLVALALVIAIPLCWLFMHRWLADYSYRISFPWWTAAAGGLGMLIAFLTIGFQTVKAATANPVESLKTE